MVDTLRRGAERYAMVVVWGLMILFYSAVEPSRFATSGTFRTIFSSQAALVFLSMAFLCTVIVGEFVDLSVAGILGLCATVVPVLSVMHGMPVWLASVIAVLIGIAAGAINGAPVLGVRLNIIVVTLGMSTLLLGIAAAIAHLHVVSGLPASYSKIALLEVGGLPISFYYGIAIVLVFAYVLGFTPLGRHMRFVGANREVSRLAGIRVNRIRFGAFVMAGFLSGLGGGGTPAGLGGFDPSSSVTYLLPTVSAGVLRNGGAQA